MSTLNFTLNPDTNLYEAEVQSGLKNVLQIEFPNSDLRAYRTIEVFVRVSPDLSWARIKLFSQQIDNLPVAIHVPADLYLKFAVSEQPKSAAFLA